MIAFTLDRSKKWRLPEWKDREHIWFCDDKYQDWQSSGRAITLSEVLNRSDWVEYQEPQPEPEKKKLRVWLSYYGGYIYFSKSRANPCDSDVTRKFSEVLREELEK